jgi:hypothetical protein
MHIIIWSVLVGLLFFSGTTATAQPKTKLKPKTVEAFDNYIKERDKEYQLIVSGKKPFLWVSRQGSDVQKRVRSGEIVIFKERENMDVPDGIIHIWGVSTFMPGASAEEVVKLLRDYDRHKDIYPSVVDSKLLGTNGDTVRGYLRLTYKKVITVVLDTEHESTLTKVGEGKYALRVRSTRIAEVDNPGEASEKELPVGEDSGFMWRLNTYWMIAQAEGGVFVECSSVTLTRNIPMGLGWLIRPFIKSIPRDSLEELVKATRVAVHK